jgi:hypothetical protein
MAKSRLILLHPRHFLAISAHRWSFPSHLATTQLNHGRGCDLTRKKPCNKQVKARKTSEQRQHWNVIKQRLHYVGTGPFEMPEGAEYSITYLNDGKSRNITKHIDIFRQVIRILQSIRSAVVTCYNFTHFFVNSTLLAISYKVRQTYTSVSIVCPSCIGPILQRLNCQIVTKHRMKICH